MNSIRVVVAGVVLAGAMIFGSVQPASAQFGQAVAISELMKPEFINRDMIIFVEGLDLDSDQQAIIESMFEAYRDEFEEGKEQLRNSFEEMRSELNPDDPQRVLKLVFAPFDQWRGQREIIRNRFMENVKLVLNEQQLSQWSSFEKRLLREKTLDRGELSGEHLNIFHVLQDIHINERTYMSIEPILAEYAMELDTALKARNEVINDTKGTMLRALQEQDSAKMLQFVGKQIKRRVAVRNVNDHYVRLLTSALPESLASQFHNDAMARAYPKIYRRSSAKKLYEAAMQHDDLSSEVKETVRELYANYNESLENMNGRLLEMIRVHEPEAKRHQSKAASARMNNEPYSRLPNPAVVQYRKRDKMVRDNVDLLKWTVGNDVFITLPGASRWLRPEKPERSAMPNTITNPEKRSVTPGGNRSLTAEPADVSGKGKGKGKPDPNNPGAPDE